MSRTYRRRGQRHDRTAPRWYRRIFDHQLRTVNERQLRRWLDDPHYAPVFVTRHRHNANWSWS